MGTRNFNSLKLSETIKIVFPINISEMYEREKLGRIFRNLAEFQILLILWNIFFLLQKSLAAFSSRPRMSIILLPPDWRQ